MGGVMGVNKSQEEEIQQVETAGIVADKLPPIEEYEKTRKKNKKHAVCGLTLLIAIEAAIAGAFGYQISEKNLNTRVFREHEIRASGKIQLTQGFYSGETNFGLFEGNGIFSYDIGEEYSGNWHDDQISGEGTLRVPTEGTYKGDFSRSKKNGKGIFTWDDGAVYDGEWKNDKMCGQGTYTSSDGVTYEGTFEENSLKDGSCTFTNKTGSYVVTYKSGEVDKLSINYADGAYYEGACTGETLTGTGKMSFVSGDKYDGEFVSGKRNGQGMYTWASGDKYDGEWSNDQMSGSGIYTYSDGSYASGTFELNLFTDGSYHIENDFGIYTFTIVEGEPVAVEMSLVSGTTYNGEMQDGKLSGQAQIKYSNGDKYSGNVSEGKKSDQGTYTWVSGASYDGKWSDDQMNGAGTYLYPSSENGYKLSGTFENGKPSGECQYYVNSSTHYKTDWVKGKCVKIYE